MKACEQPPGEDKLERDEQETEEFAVRSNSIYLHTIKKVQQSWCGRVHQ